MKSAQPYGAWPSPITADVMLSAFVSFSELAYRAGACYWLEGRPTEGGRAALVRHHDGTSRDLTPEPFNVRSRVHEYGGGAFALSDDTAWFVNFEDQNIYAVDLPGALPVRVTTGDAAERFGGLVWDPHGQCLVAIRERHGFASEAVNDLVRIDPVTGDVDVLHAGHDFYAAHRLSGDGRRIAFLVWDHPNMPWDGTQLIAARIGADGLSDETLVAGGAAESVLQPEWIGNDRLLYVSDESGFWNLHSYDDSGVYCTVPDDAEYGLPMWHLDTRAYVVAGPRHVVAQRIEEGTAELVVADVDQGMTTPMPVDFTGYRSLTRTDSGVAFIAGRRNDVAAIVELDLATGAVTLLASQGDVDFPPGTFAEPEAIRFPSGEATAYGNFYPPSNPGCVAPEGELPPLLVVSHGGPTGAASRDLSFGIQYYTSRGWAVLDVNYGGSTGFGRPYRERLNARWGLVDVGDCVAGVRHLTAEGRVDPARVAIRGGSAGGYTTLAALAFSTAFRAGAVHYGIGDLAALARDTHKFESRYVHRLVDEADFAARSPVEHVDRLRCPTIFFQGTEDRIVPPNQAETMFHALRAKGIPVAHILFEGEGHGFRKVENARRAIESEYFFFGKVFGFEPADDLPGVRVENATWT